jgi:hypothetical protein
MFLRQQRDKVSGIYASRVKQDERVTKALLATTSTFTDSALEFGKPHIWELQLIDHEAIMKMIKDYASDKNKTS